jgi:hypothetical protein
MAVLHSNELMYYYLDTKLLLLMGCALGEEFDEQSGRERKNSQT